MDEKPTFSDVLANTGFKILWLNQILVQLAYNTVNFALIIWVFKLTDSSFAVSALILSMYLPAALFGIFAGVFVDITDRRKIIQWIDGLLAISFFLFIFIKGSFPLILLNTLFINSLAQFFVPAEGSSIPLLVPKRQLLLANSLFSLTLYGSFMVGFAVAGPILNFFGINYAFGAGVIAMIIGFFVTQLLPEIKVGHMSKKYANFISLSNLENMFLLTVSETKKTYSFIRGKISVLVSIIILSSVQGVIGVLAVVMSAYMEKVLRIHATDASYFLMIPLGLGMVTGAYLIGKFGHDKPRRKMVVPAMLLAGSIFIMAGLVPIIAQFVQSADLPALPEKIRHPRYFFKAPSLSLFFAAGAFILGLAAVTIIIPSQTVLQESTNEKIRGKIFSVLAVMMNVISIIPVVLSGALADLFGPAPIFVGVGLFIFVCGALAMWPHVFFKEHQLSKKMKEFLGLGHWRKT
jgi:MFS family permease